MAEDGAVVDIHARHAPVVLVSAVPAFGDVVTLVDFLSPASEDGDVEFLYPFATETQHVVIAVVVGRESVGNA